MSDLIQEIKRKQNSLKSNHSLTYNLLTVSPETYCDLMDILEEKNDTQINRKSGVANFRGMLLRVSNYIVDPSPFCRYLIFDNTMASMSPINWSESFPFVTTIKLKEVFQDLGYKGFVK